MTIVCAMFALSIKEFGINTEHVFARPVPFERADFLSLSEAMLKSFSLALLPKDILLDQGDRLFNYRLTFGLFDGSADATLTSAGLATAFRNGRNRKALDLVGNCLVAIDAVIQRHQIDFRRLTFAAHAQFSSAEEFNAQMAEIADISRGYSAGGVILRSSKNPFTGELRFSTDKSLVYENALFVGCEFLVKDVFSGDLLKKMAERFAEVATDADLKVDLDL